MSFLYTVVAFIVALGILIIVHEYGHYLVARACRVKVLRFSVGFGRPLLLWKRGADGTEWVLAAVPFGGYVKMLDEREGPVDPSEAGRAFNRQSVWKRFLIVVAGPAFNFLFAVLVYAGLFMYGMPEARPVLAEPPAGTIAAAAGLSAGDSVRATDGEPISSWQDLRWRMVQAALQGHKIRLETVNPKGHLGEAVLDLSAFASAEVESDVLELAGLRLYRPKLEAVLGEMEAGSPARQAGLSPGDRVLEIEGKPVASWEDFVKLIQASPEKPLSLLIERGAGRIKIEVTPASKKAADGKQIGRIGAAARDLEKFYTRVSYGPGASFVKAVGKTFEISLFSLKMLGKMVIGQLSLKHISGPVTIADFAGQSAQMGITYYLTFLALISISLGVLNLLPIPLLDGGHLMYYAIELIKGKPVSERAMELGQRVGLALLLVMMAFAFYNDFNRLLSG
jgi:regulator of sigma E protease